MGKFDKVKKKIKKKKREIHFGYIFLLVAILAIGIVTGTQYEKTKRNELHRLGLIYNDDVKALEMIIESHRNEINIYKTYLDSIPLGTPIDVIEIASDYGYRVDPFDTIILFHKGLDLQAKLKQEIYTPADGIVTRAEYVRGYGLCVNVKHSQDYSTVYAHLNNLIVSKGDSVSKGDVVGLAGSTGKSTNVHLHYEVRKENLPLDPEDFINIQVKALGPEN